MGRIKIATEYAEQHLEVDRPQTLSDNKIESLINEVLDGKLDKTITDKVYSDFELYTQDRIFNSRLNRLTGIESFNRVDITMGCTQFIDTLYMNQSLQVLAGDYRYHQRLNPALLYSVPGYLIPNKPLIIAMPFPSLGDVHKQMKEILDECLDKQIKVHIDGAWVSCSRNIVFDFRHAAIESVAFSLSKGYGLGWNRIGLRYKRDSKPDAITLMNDYHMNNRALVLVANHFMRNLPIDYIWNTHKHRYEKVCADFNLAPTNSIHIAMRNNQPVGVAPLIRYLETNGI